MSHPASPVRLSSLTGRHTHELVLPGSLTQARTHPHRLPPRMSHSVSLTRIQGHITHSCSLISLYHFLSSQAWQGAQETISTLGNLKGWDFGDLQSDRVFWPLPTVSCGTLRGQVEPSPIQCPLHWGSISPADNPRLAQHQDGGRGRARPRGQSRGDLLTSAPALTRDAPAMAPGLPQRSTGTWVLKATPGTSQLL